ncbi:hypothetical protein Thal_0038 [Thermocrinis albus DSM 14484]|uniref:Prepilin-type N-terminal cleavage/methylation domain-containing protein n=1 Tax=Thermocrinis albus (strain DSM 14484 / JCM 11386 / HI 11/12) TaxID=638303 RepID=D3SND9_THEAH|nr:type II secretion system protein [Thermocrinis albus]ADC88676.1 hypothetical protein Thal_0038 [Thermocrinis albus DSM 14484]
MLNKRHGFTILEILVATLIIMLVGIALLTGILQYNRYSMKVQAKREAEKILQSMADYIRSLPYDSWLLNPNDQLHYCNDCIYNRAFCDAQQGSCSFMQPSGGFDPDGDGLPSIMDPYYGNNNCKQVVLNQQGNINCESFGASYKYRGPTENMAGWLRLVPDFLSGTSFCRCALGNCKKSDGTDAPLVAQIGSGTYYNNLDFLPIRCYYEFNTGQPVGGSVWTGKTLSMYAGMVVVNYTTPKAPVTIVGKAIGVIVWWFDPVDHNYRYVYKIIFREKP